jgi:hypothetical protein
MEIIPSIQKCSQRKGTNIMVERVSESSLSRLYHVALRPALVMKCGKAYTLTMSRSSKHIFRQNTQNSISNPKSDKSVSKLMSLGPVSIIVYVNTQFNVPYSSHHLQNSLLPGALASGYWNCASVDPNADLRGQHGIALNGVRIDAYTVLNLRAGGRIMLKALFLNLRLKPLHVVLKMKSDCFIHAIGFYDG